MKKKQTDKQEKEYHTPQGTIILMIVFILLIITLWGTVYLTLLARGATG